MVKILDEYKSYMDRQSGYPLGLNISIRINNQGEINYNFPLTTEECQMMEHNWYCPTLFSLFTPEEFFEVLTAVLLEKSVVFVTDNLTILTSTILGFKTLLKPFQWCYAMIPVLPAPLIDILDTPQPILVGITRSDYKNVELSEEEILNRTWVFLDENKIEWGELEEEFQDYKLRKRLMKWCSRI